MRDDLSAAYVEVIDESWKHAGHAGAAAGGGHFILRVVSERFEGISLMDRHRMVFRILEKEMRGEIHALVITVMTPRERGAS